MTNRHFPLSIFSCGRFYENAYKQMRKIGIKKKKQIVKQDEIGIEEYNEELVLKKPPKKSKVKSNTKKEEVLLQSRLTTAQEENIQKRTDYQNYIQKENDKWTKLKPSEIHQVIITPADVDFKQVPGRSTVNIHPLTSKMTISTPNKVAVKSTAKQNLTIINNFHENILFQLDLISQQELNQVQYF